MSSARENPCVRNFMICDFNWLCGLKWIEKTHIPNYESYSKCLLDEAAEIAKCKSDQTKQLDKCLERQKQNITSK